MNNRLIQFLAAENITQSQFADSIGVARAGISHIIAGRNKPGYDFITAVLRRYPTLNIEWLLCGKGKMYKEQRDPASTTALNENSRTPDLNSTASDRVGELSPAAGAPSPGEWGSPDSDLLFNPEEFVGKFRSVQSAASEDNVSGESLHSKTTSNPLHRCASQANSMSSCSFETSNNTTKRIEIQRKITKITVFFNDGTYQELGAL